MVFLVGEAGIGKTRLAQEIALDAGHYGFLVACGRCYENRQVVGFYPVLEALATIYDACPPAIRGEVPDKWPYLGRLLPHHDVSINAFSGGAEEQDRLFHSVAGFLCAVAAQQPLAVMLDDLHWADAASLDLLQQLARHTRGSRVLIVGTFRDVEVRRPHPLTRLLNHLQREQLLERINVPRLAEDETRTLISFKASSGRVSSELAALVHRSTEGNPFFIHEVLRGLLERGDIRPGDGGQDSRLIDQIVVPASVRDAIGERLSRLNGLTQAILHEASVLGQTFSFEELEGIGERGEAEVEEALEQALASGLVQEAGRDGLTDHALTQGTLYGELSARRRRKLHLAAGGDVGTAGRAATSGREAELAHHFLEGDDPERALTYSMRAGELADAVFAHAEAEQHFQTALELAQKLQMEVRQAELHEKLGRTLRIQGQFEVALEHLEAAARSYGTLQEQQGEARIVVQIGRVYHRAGNAAAGLDRIDRLLQTVDPTVPTLAMAELFGVRAHLLWLAARNEESLSAAEHAGALARALGDEAGAARVLSDAEMRRGQLLGLLGRPEDSRRVLEAALPIAEQAGDPVVLGIMLQGLARSHEASGDFEQALRLKVQAIAIAERLGNPGETALYITFASSVLFLLGRAEEARAELERAEGMVRSAEPSWLTAGVAACAGWLYLQLGDWDEAIRSLEAGGDIHERLGLYPMLLWAQAGLAWLEVLQGKPERAVARAEHLLNRLGWDRADGAWVLCMLALAHAELGNGTRGQSLAAPGSRVCGRKRPRRRPPANSRASRSGNRRGKTRSAEGVVRNS